jgi:hypothetical protein
MGFNIGDVFGRIPESDFERAVNSGLLLSAAVSIFYIFFGRLLSLPELLSVTLRAPACTPRPTQPNSPASPS